MAGGPSTPGLAAAVSGGRRPGVPGRRLQDARPVAAEIEAVRAASVPVGVNLFLVEPYEPDDAVLDAYRRSLEPEAARFGVDLGRAAVGRRRLAGQARPGPRPAARRGVVHLRVPRPRRAAGPRRRGVLSTVTVTSVVRSARGRGPRRRLHWPSRATRPAAIAAPGTSGRSPTGAAARPRGRGRGRRRVPVAAGGGLTRRGRCGLRARTQAPLRPRSARRTCSPTRPAPTRCTARR